MDSKYSSYFLNYCNNQINNIIDELRNERNEYSFRTAYLYDQHHKGKVLLLLVINNLVICTNLLINRSF